MLLVELFKYLRNSFRFNEDNTRFYAAQIALGKEYLHSIGRKYVNLMPENIFIDNKGYIRLTKIEKIEEHLDLDKAFLVDDKNNYLAPELYSWNIDNKNADWWTFGIIIFEMLCGISPFINDRNRILFGKVKFPKLMVLSDDVKNVVIKLLEKDPLKRLGSKTGIKEIKSHPFF